MLKEFIKHIQETTTPRTITVDGHTFLVTSDGNAHEYQKSDCKGGRASPKRCQ